MAYTLKKLQRYIDAIAYGIEIELKKQDNIIGESINEDGEQIYIMEVDKNLIIRHAMVHAKGKLNPKLLFQLISLEIDNTEYTKHKREFS